MLHKKNDTISSSLSLVSTSNLSLAIGHHISLICSSSDRVPLICESINEDVFIWSSAEVCMMSLVAYILNFCLLLNLTCYLLFITTLTNIHHEVLK